MLDEQQAIQVLVRDIENYAAARANDVRRGAKTPRLAALMIQNYGAGQCHALRTIYGNPQACDAAQDTVEAACDVIRPQWRSDTQRRWAARPADLAI